VSHSVVAEFDLARMRDEFRFPFVLQYEQYKLTASIAAEYANASDFDVRFSHCVTDLTETADGVELAYTSPDGEGRLKAAYVIGCDGGRSTIRKLAGIEFEGFTYPERFIKIATTFDFGTVNDHLVLRNYFSDPDEWCNLFKVRGKRPPGLWRAIFPVGNEEPDEVAVSPERLEARLHKFFPKAGRYEVEYVNVYPVSQRVAATFRQGRVLLAGDSAHVNNPIGGMGMNGGIHDAVNLAEKLADVWFGRADASLLDRYTRQRRTAQVDYVQAQTIENKRKLEEKDPAIRRQHLDELRRASEDVARHKKFLYRSSLIDSLTSANAVE
jgi:2-polyprenyl-6-methoxyphenol hydroxylase-like FAD-dependent oxidoreductase